MGIVFTEKIKQESNMPLIYLVQGYEQKVKTWYYIRVPSNKSAVLSRLTPHAHVDLNEIGEIIYSGYGDFPPDYVREAVEKERSSTV